MSVCNVGVFWPNCWMDQDATWFGGRPRHRTQCVRWRPSCPLRKGHSSPPPHFSVHVYCGKRLDGSGYHLIRGGPRPRQHVLDGQPAPPRKGAQQSSTFRSMFIVAKRSPILDLATAELLFYLSSQLFRCFRPLNATLAILKVELYLSCICTSIGHA